MKKAFSLLELVIVIVAIGIIAIAVIPRYDRDTIQEATDQIISHIRYTQHLAMQDNRFDPTVGNWWASRWRIEFNNASGDIIYSIQSGTTVARNPEDTTLVLNGAGTNATKSLNLTEKYGITSLTSSANCRAANTGVADIAFDYMGRPLGLGLSGAGSTTNPYADLIQNECTLTITSGSRSCQIVIQPETGYTHQEQACTSL